MARSLRPALVVLIGLPGAGKSTLARALCRRLRLARVDRDAIRARLFPRGPFDAAAKRAATRAAFAAAEGALARRRGAVLDGMTFATQAQRRRARALARRHGARCVEIFVDCPRALARERIAADRGHPARDRRPALVDAVARRFAPVSRRALRVDARAPTRAQLRDVLAAAF